MTEDKKFRILIVDDEPDNLALLYRTLRGKYVVDRSLSPLKAIEMIKENEYQLIISDHKMPEMDGVHFLKWAHTHSPNVMRILLTAYSEISILIDAINYAKIYRYIKKPFNPDELLLIVDAALEYYQLKKENEILIKDLKELFAGTINAIVGALDAKDKFTVGRSKRVTFYSMKMAEKLNLSDVEKSRLEIAGMLHDIGMIGVSDELLLKTESLTNEDLEEIKKHVSYSVKILTDIKHLKETVQIIKYHHEHWDGGGYPEGISEWEIPIGSRIIAVADAYDSMMSNRAYRPPFGHEKALSVIQQNSGSQFDPEVVKAFLQIFEDEQVKDFASIYQ